MVRIPGTEKLSQPRDGEDDERDNDDDDDGMKLGTMDLPQVSGGTACRELQEANRNYHTSRHSRTEDMQRGSHC